MYIITIIMVVVVFIVVAHYRDWGTGKMRNAENRECVKCVIRLAEKYCGT